MLLANLGTPDAPTPMAVKHFLAEFLSDVRVVDISKIIWQPLLHLVILLLYSIKVAKLYRLILTKTGYPLLNYSS